MLVFQPSRIVGLRLDHRLALTRTFRSSDATTSPQQMTVRRVEPYGVTKLGCPVSSLAHDVISGLPLG
jgi:hypothetical protein